MTSYKFVTREEITENARCGDSTVLLVEESLALRLFAERDAYREVAMIELSRIHHERECECGRSKEQLLEDVDAEAARVLEKK